MKKAGGSSKDRLAKSGNPKKRTPSGGANATGASPLSATLPSSSPSSSNPQGGGIDDVDPPTVIWPEWNDAEIAAEKWATKHTFEDPEGPLCLPKSLRGYVDAFKRPTEMVVPGTGELVAGWVGVGNMAGLDELFYTMPSEKGSVVSPPGTAGNGTLSAPLGLGHGTHHISNHKSTAALAAAPSSVPVTVSGDSTESSEGATTTGAAASDGTNGNVNVAAEQQAAEASAENAHVAADTTTSATSVPPATTTGLHQSASSTSVAKGTTNSNSALNASSSASGAPNEDNTSASNSTEPNEDKETNNSPIVSPSSSPEKRTPSSAHQKDPHHPQTPLSHTEDDTHSLTDTQPAQQTHQLPQPPTSRFYAANKHLLPSDLLRTILTTFHFLYDHSKTTRLLGSPPEDSPLPWDNLYPKTKDGLPMINPSGKYA
ncbi:hypothetical protein HDV05_000983, partial [Chytridiales sp. JEL 0842]